MTKNLKKAFQFLDKITKSDSDYSFAKVVGQVYLCIESARPTFTDFLDPNRRGQALSALGLLTDYGLRLTEDGGYPDAERKILGFSHENADFAPFPIAGVKLEFDAKYGTIAHRDVLGAILGLGLSRNVIGDVVMLAGSAVVYGATASADFITQSITTVGRVAVSASILPADSMIFPLDNRLTERIIAASLRLDNLVAAAFNLSRSEAANMVKSGKTNIKWVEENSPAKLVKEGDMLTVRRLGRVRLKEICGKSRKDRFLIDILRY